MVTFYQFPTNNWVLPSPSPFCLKLETWLRLAGVAYEEKPWSPTKAPLGKAPVIGHEGALVPDSSKCIDYLTKAFDVSLDAGLTAEQQARATLMQRTLEEHLYWALLFARWVEPEGWRTYKSVIGASLPALLRPVMLPMLRRGVIKSSKAHGLGLHDRDEIISRASKDLSAISTTLGDAPYLLGDEPHSIDAIGFGFLAQFIVPEHDHPICNFARNDERLVAYVERMQERVWNES